MNNSNALNAISSFNENEEKSSVEVSDLIKNDEQYG